MQFLDNLIILTLIAGAFLCGKHFSDSYHRKAKDDITYALQKQYARIVAGCDADDAGQPYVPYPNQAITPSFMERLRKNKQATMQLK